MRFVAEPMQARQSLRRVLEEIRVEPPLADAVRVAGKFFRVGGLKWYVKGLTYGPFAQNEQGLPLPPPQQIVRDFRQIRQLGSNCIRLYHVPPRWLLDLAGEHGLRVFVDVPWEKHRCFFEDWSSQEAARAAVRDAATELRDHPALFAISVVNELPSDIVRFYGAQRVQRFCSELIDQVRQASPATLATFTSFPSTEFLELSSPDFLCFNVYLEQAQRLASYLSRLQHLAGSKPLILGEFGVDSIRKGEAPQAQMLCEHVEQVFAHGLAGSFVFSFTDEWHTGGHAIEDWAFGITTRDRQEKPAAQLLRATWSRAPRPLPAELPSVSVVVCSYNGAATLAQCLESLQRLNYPDFELILVDDGSTDNTPQIAGRFPAVRCIRQQNLGLSVARNTGALAARGQIVAYTDSDCVADEDWLLYLVQAMQQQNVDAIGGPNLPPPADQWTARCVAASPGGPSHVMLDDRYAEHVPGCNMAFNREKLLALGGFDAQFRQAGDDVDICWRFMDAGMSIGYAPAALVWHYRRNTLRAYLSQQRGYGRSEAMLFLKHPQRFNDLGAACWKGIIYGEGAVGLETRAPTVFHGRFGQGLFQPIYRSGQYSRWIYPMLLEWHGMAAFMLVMSLCWWPLALAPAGMWLLSLAALTRAAVRAPLAPRGPWWSRPLIFIMYLLQPIVRGLSRYRQLLLRKYRGRMLPDEPVPAELVRPIAAGQAQLCWNDRSNRGREQLLDAFVKLAGENGWAGDFLSVCTPWDVRLFGYRWHELTIRTASEELGWPRRFTRARFRLKLCGMARVAIGLLIVGSAIAGISGSVVGLCFGAGLGAAAAAVLIESYITCRRAVERLLHVAGIRAGLTSVAVRSPSTKVAAQPVLLDDEPSLGGLREIA